MLQVEIHVTKMYCLSRSSLNLPLLVEDAARSEEDIEKSVKVENNNVFKIWRAANVLFLISSLLFP